MNQKIALPMFFTGLATFLTSLGEFFSSHNSWSEMSTPNEIGHIMLITASFVVTVIGALGTQMPRDKNTRSTDKVSNNKLSEINRERIDEN